jgi:CheY-like chemotaxis protein
MRRWSITTVIACAMLVIGFSGWCLAVLTEVSRLRGELEQRVGWLGELQAIQNELSAAAPQRLPEVERLLRELDLDLGQHRAPSDALAQELAMTIVEARALTARPEDPARRAAVAAGVADSVARLRGENRAVSEALGGNWSALQYIAMSAVAMSACLLGLLGRNLLVVGPRLRDNAERLAKLSIRLGESSAAAAGVGHELGGPLTSALTSLQLLRDDLRSAGEAREDRMRMLEDAIAALSRATGTLQDLRASSDSVDEPTGDAHAALDEALAATRFRGGDRQRVTIDAERVGRVALPQPVVCRLFAQILGGAAKPTASTHAVAVRLRQEQALITVEFGLGRAAPGAFTAVAGALAVLGGSLRVRREADSDIVRVELPSARALVPALAPVPVEPPPIRILLIDDDPSVLSSVARVLTRHLVSVTTDPDEAIELAIAGDFQLVLCDMMMPRKSGLEVFEAVTQARPDLAARFVFMSGGSIDAAGAAALERAPARIDKPFGAEELRRLVARYGDNFATP